ncbi:MAG: PepSY domain-containing protein [Armatimonadetes bacterium]|nr:PepSY domain-containing protein [Armatimonadota bacterium]
MYHKIRSSHKIGGVIFSLFFLVLASTGLLLALKDSLGFVRPPEAKVPDFVSAGAIVSIERVLEAVLAQKIPEIASHRDIDRIDYRPNKNLFKVLSKRGYHEVQVHGSTGEVLGVETRNDQLIEDIHDLQFFGEGISKYALPVIAVALAGMAATGIWIYAVPVLRRRKFQKKSQ